MDDATPHQPIDPVEALSNIEDDEAVHHEAQRWAEKRLIAGDPFEEVVAGMVGDGWAADAAERIVEQARKNTRQERGIITRQDVVNDLNVDYRRATGGLSVAFRSGLFGLYGFTTGFMAALRSFRKLKQIRVESESARATGKE